MSGHNHTHHWLRCAVLLVILSLSGLLGFLVWKECFQESPEPSPDPDLQVIAEIEKIGGHVSDMELVVPNNGSWLSRVIEGDEVVVTISKNVSLPMQNPDVPEYTDKALTLLGHLSHVDNVMITSESISEGGDDITDELTCEQVQSKLPDANVSMIMW
jgi:hypothetical protein